VSAVLREAGWQLRRTRRGLVGWSLALAAVSAIYVSFYPAIGAEQLQSMIDVLPPELAQAMGYDRMGSAAGYVTSTVYALLGMALLVVFTVGAAARIVAGEEESGLVELDAAGPVTRAALVDGRALALVLRVTFLVAVLFLVTAALVAVNDLDVTTSGLVAGSLQLGLFAVALGLVTLSVGAATGRRTVALAAGSGLAVVSYVADALAGIVADAAWLADVSPFSWFVGGDPLVTGVDVSGVARLATLGAVAWLIGRWRIGRRDLGV
jgi:ABC-2 type transport system permease protein